MTPQLWGEDLPSVVKWIRETVANAGRTEVGLTEETTAAVSSESIGMARVWLGTDVPTGWLEMDATLVFIDQYPDLYAVLGADPGPSGFENMFYLPPAPTALTAGTWIIKAL